jgi:transporter family-2 protein
MQSLVPIILLGLLGGIAVGIQSPLASLISQRLGLLESVFIVHLGGALCAGLPLIFKGGGQLPAPRS